MAAMRTQPPRGGAKARQSMGLSGLSNQIYRKVAKKGYEFNLMVCGERNVGKSTLLATLFGSTAASTDDLAERPPSPALPQSTVTVSPRTVELSEHGVNLRLTVIDTPGFGDFLNNRDCHVPLEKYIDDAFRSYMQDESRADRKNIVDRRVHALLYFIPPSAHGLKHIDIVTMRKLHHKVNVIPVIAKADMLTKSELSTLKRRVLEDVESSAIEIFMPTIAADEDIGESDEATLLSLKLAGAMPFAVVGSTATYDVGGKQVRGRKYPWGIVEVDNEEHCDYVLLKKMVVNTHLHDLKEITEEVLYERFRMHMLEKSSGTDKQNAPMSPLADPVEMTRSEEELRRDHADMKRDLEEQARLLAEERRRLEEERRRFESLAAAKNP